MHPDLLRAGAPPHASGAFLYFSHHLPLRPPESATESASAWKCWLEFLSFSSSQVPPPTPAPHLTDPWKKPCRSSQQERVRWADTDAQQILLEACCAPSVHANVRDGFLTPLLCRATWNAGPADLSAASRCQSQRGHGVPQRCLQWEELGIPHEGEEFLILCHKEKVAETAVSRLKAGTLPTQPAVHRNLLSKTFGFALSTSHHSHLRLWDTTLFICTATRGGYCQVIVNRSHLRH